MNYSKKLILLFSLLICITHLSAQQGAPGPLTTLQVTGFKRIPVQGFRLCGKAEFLPGEPNKLYCSMNSAVFDVVTGELTTKPKADQKDREASWERRYVIDLGNDPRWAAVQIQDRTDKAPVVDGRYQPQVLIVKGTDSLRIPVSFWTVSGKAYSGNYPYFWMALQTEQNGITYQHIKRYDAERHVVSEYRFKLPDQSGFDADFIQPVGQDADHIWYSEEELGLYAFDKRDQQLYACPTGVPGYWDFIGQDSALLYFFDGLKSNLLAVNKAWLDQKRKPYDGSKSLEEVLAFQSLQDSFSLQRAPDLEQFLQNYRYLHGLYGSSENKTIKTAFDEMPTTLLRRLYQDKVFSTRAFQQFPALKHQAPEALLPALCAGLMDYALARGDLDAYADFYALIQQTRPGYFLEEGTLLGAACVAKILRAQKDWQQIREQQIPPDEQLWKKSELVATVFRPDDPCNMTLGGGKMTPKENPIPVAHVYADLSRQHPGSKRAAEAVCKVVAWRAAGAKIPLEIWEDLLQASQSDCIVEAETALFWTLVTGYGDDYRARLPRALDFGRQLLKKYPNLPDKSRIQSKLEDIEAELNNPDGN